MDTSVEQEGELKLYPNRKRVLWYVEIILLFFLCMLTGDIFLIWTFFVHSASDSGVPAFAGICPLATLLLGWLLCFMARKMRRPSFWITPTLIINRQGLRYRFWSRTSSTFIPWEEIAFVSSGTPGHFVFHWFWRPYFLIALKDVQRFKKLYGNGQRFYSSRDAETGSHLSIHWVWLNVPIPQILQHIREAYNEELRQHDVQVRNTEGLSASSLRFGHVNGHLRGSQKPQQRGE